MRIAEKVIPGIYPRAKQGNVEGYGLKVAKMREKI
jgi:hypothetical protein